MSPPERISTYRHALGIWLEEHVRPPWRRYLRDEAAFNDLVYQVEQAGFRFTTRVHLERTLRELLMTGD